MGFIRRIQIRFADSPIDDYGIGNRPPMNKSLAIIALTLIIAPLFAGCSQQETPPPQVTTLPLPTYPDEAEARALWGVSAKDAPNEVLIGWRRSHDWARNATVNERNKLGPDTIVFDGGTLALDAELRESISKAGNLRWLRATVVNAEELQWVCTLVKLRGLTVIAERNMVGFDLQQLANLKELEWLDIQRISPRKLGSDRLPALPKLEVLNLNFQGFSDDYLPDGHAYPKLHALSLKNSAITDTGLAKFIDDHCNLTMLNMYGSPITALSIPELGKLQKLRYLGIALTPLIESPRDPELFNRKDWVPLQSRIPNCYLSCYDLTNSLTHAC